MAAAARSSRNSRLVHASPEAIYDLFLDPVALEAFLAPDGMTGRVHEFEAGVGGGYRMSLFYSAECGGGRGKSADLEDRFVARFVELAPHRRIVQAVTFDSADPAFAGEMVMQVSLDAEAGGTRVTIEFTGIPPGIRPEDNEAGTRQSLEKLARLFEPREWVLTMEGERTLFTWDQIEAARQDHQLQSEFPLGEAQARYLEHARACVSCGEPPADHEWLFWRDPRPHWENLSGREGWLTLCRRCTVAVDFFVTGMN